MCTAATYKTKDFYFGRTFDYEFSYGEEVVITPRKYPFEFRTKGKMESHLAMIGTAYVMQDYPLYYEATTLRLFRIKTTSPLSSSSLGYSVNAKTLAMPVRF